jgi:glycosyltransferase involved in cell wall biosynthesis
MNPSARAAPLLAIVVPCFNEEAALPHTAAELLRILETLTTKDLVRRDSAIYFVDDGSTDATWTAIAEWAAKDSRCHGIKLSRNFGHQHALLCGMLTAPGDATVTIDADLQDDPAAIHEMITAYMSGADVVYGVRADRRGDHAVKRWTAEGYYRVARLLGVELVFNHADFRLMSRRAVDALREYTERNLFLRAIVPRLGFRSTTVGYTRNARVAGRSKYPVRKMLAFAVDGITSFSAVPLQLITWLGLAVSLGSFATALWAIWVRIFNPAAVPGWASTLVPMSLFGGIQLFCTGIIGQYLAKIYLETKGRPRYVIETTI